MTLHLLDTHTHTQTHNPCSTILSSLALCTCPSHSVASTTLSHPQISQVLFLSPDFPLGLTQLYLCLPLSLSALLLPFNLRQSTSAHFNPALIVTKRKTNSLSRALQLILKQLLLFFIRYLQCKRCAQWRCEEWKHTFSFAPVWLSSSPSLSLSFKSICTLRGEWKLNGSNSILSWSP